MYDPKSKCADDFINHEVIVIGGGISSAFTYYKHSMYQAMQAFPYTETVKRVKIFVTEIEDVALLGASALVGKH